MPDISMCHGKDCPLKKYCFRNQAKPSDFNQSWIDEAWRDGECENFLIIVGAFPSGGVK